MCNVQIVTQALATWMTYPHLQCPIASTREYSRARWHFPLTAIGKGCA